MLPVLFDVTPQSFGIFEGSQRTIDRTDDLPEKYLRGRPFETIATLGSSHALHEAGVLQFEEDQFEKLFGQIVGGCYFSYLDGPFPVAASQKDQCLESVQAFLGYFHCWLQSRLFPYSRSIGLLDLSILASFCVAREERIEDQYIPEMRVRFSGFPQEQTRGCVRPKKTGL